VALASVALAAVVLIIVIPTLNGASAAHAETAVVERVIDGDTLDVRLDGKLTRVRLLNIDTPETKDPSKPVECLGPEAAAMLTQLAPVGSSVTLSYDQERTDRYGRLLATVTLANGADASEVLATNGLGRAIQVGRNGADFERVLAAQSRAAESGVGLYSDSISCTVPAELSQLSSQVAGVVAVAAAATTSGQAREAEAAAAGLVARVTALSARLAPTSRDASWLFFGPVYRSKITSEVGGLSHSLTATLASASTAAADFEASEAAVAQADQLAAAARAAAEAAAAEAAAAEAAKRVAVPPAPPVQEQSSSAGQSDSYTGCRAYAPGGKTYKPIPCP